MNEMIIDEIVVFLMHNNGPDNEGRGHPNRVRLHCSDLESAISRAEQMGLPPGLKPYHFKGTLDVWKTPKYVNEVVVKKIDQLLAEKYSNDLVSLIMDIHRDYLSSPLTENYNGRVLKVSTCSIVFSEFGNNVFDFIRRYIEVKGLQAEFSNFKPYHLARTTRDTYNDKKYLHEVIVKKVDQLLAGEKYKGDIVQLLIEAGDDELSSPMIDSLNGRQIEVSMFHIGTMLTICQLFISFFFLKGIEFPFDEKCFSRNSATRKRRIAEVCARTNYSAYINKVA